MNATAEEIGAFDTVAGTPSGLDVAGQSSSPYDLALVFRRLVADPATAAILATPTAQMPPVEGRSPGYQIQNQNPLAGYPGGLGGKTGFTDAARHTFVTAAERDGRRLVVSVMDTENQPLRAADQAGLLLDWGFATEPATAGVGRLVTSGAEALSAPSTTTPGAPVAPATHAASPATPAVTAARDGEGLPVAGAVLAVLAVGVVVATVLGRRRAVISPPGPDDAGSPSTPP
jgi:D-alanyl-D-alanine carboxypeptidase (penicillin-binding protein 5/6)